MLWDGSGRAKTKRPLPDSNRGWRICNPLPYHLAKGPVDGIVVGRGRGVNPAQRTAPTGRTGILVIGTPPPGTLMNPTHFKLLLALLWLVPGLAFLALDA